jgi:hypothetical protein
MWIGELVDRRIGGLMGKDWEGERACGQSGDPPTRRVGASGFVLLSREPAGERLFPPIAQLPNRRVARLPPIARIASMWILPCSISLRRHRA